VVVVVLYFLIVLFEISLLLCTAGHILYCRFDWLIDRYNGGLSGCLSIRMSECLSISLLFVQTLEVTLVIVRYINRFLLTIFTRVGPKFNWRWISAESSIEAESEPNSNVQLKVSTECFSRTKFGRMTQLREGMTVTSSDAMRSSLAAYRWKWLLIILSYKDKQYPKAKHRLVKQN